MSSESINGKGREMLKSLLEGNKRWMESSSKIDHNIQTNKAADLVDYQNPDTTIITCSDSRVIPEFIFDTDIGELFVIRIAGNVITPEVLASIEFATAELDTQLIIMLGHQNCGAVQSTLNLRANSETKVSPNIRQLVDKIEVTDQDPTANTADSVKRNVKFQSDKMIEQSELIKSLRDDPDKTVCSAIYWMDSRKVEVLGVEI